MFCIFSIEQENNVFHIYVENTYTHKCRKIKAKFDEKGDLQLDVKIISLVRSKEQLRELVDLLKDHLNNHLYSSLEDLYTAANFLPRLEII